ncbi:MAG: RHS repeat protein, partial [Burkholderiaceae bacterium]|nr:RHS repeat protein [Burkholderiaceae bacterium]
MEKKYLDRKWISIFTVSGLLGSIAFPYDAFAEDEPKEQKVIVKGQKISDEEKEWNEFVKQSRLSDLSYILKNSEPRVLTNQTNTTRDGNDKNPKSCNPVIIATGEKFKEQADAYDSSLAQLSMQRTYRAFSTQARDRFFGGKWGSTFDYPKLATTVCKQRTDYTYLGCLPDKITILHPNGTHYAYAYGDGSDYYPVGTNGGISSAGYLRKVDVNEYHLVIGQRVYKYNATTNNLNAIDENGVGLYTFTYNYVAPYYQLATVEGRNNKTLSFTWSQSWPGGRVTSIVDSNSKTWTYGYNTSGHLSTVTPPSGTNGGGVRTYHYESPYDTGLLTGITVDGVRHTRYAYDASKRVTQSRFENSEAVDNFTYQTSPPATTVTNERGQTVKHYFEQVGTLRFPRFSVFQRPSFMQPADSVPGTS